MTTYSGYSGGVGGYVPFNPFTSGHAPGAYILYYQNGDPNKPVWSDDQSALALNAIGAIPTGGPSGTSLGSPGYPGAAYSSYSAPPSVAALNPYASQQAAGQAANDWMAQVAAQANLMRGNTQPASYSQPSYSVPISDPYSQQVAAANAANDWMAQLSAKSAAEQQMLQARSAAEQQMLQLQFEQQMKIEQMRQAQAAQQSQAELALQRELAGLKGSQSLQEIQAQQAMQMALNAQTRGFVEADNSAALAALPSVWALITGGSTPGTGGAGGTGTGGTGGTGAGAPLPGQPTAGELIFARAKDQAGQLASARLKDVRDTFSAHNLAGSGNEARAMNDLLTSTQTGLEGVATQNAIYDANRAAAVEDRNYAGDLTRRSQNLSTLPSMLGFLKSGRAY